MTYMQQVSLFLSGERDYARIEGDTGPLVYPAVHVYVYSILHNLTNAGKDIISAQYIFAAFYLGGLLLVMGCYCAARAPPYLFPLLVLSKRLHSIFLLRLFNDGIAMILMWASILALSNRRWLVGVVLWSIGVGVKMTLLLLAPALAVILLLGAGVTKAFFLGAIALLIQVWFDILGLVLVLTATQILLATPFLLENPTSYIGKAFEFTRQFLFKWTVNWRFVGQDIFLSKSFSVSLLAMHLSLLCTFFLLQWLKPARVPSVLFIKQTLSGKQPVVQISQKHIMSTMLSSLAVGLLCARSLHYQFYAYLSWTTPFLLWISWPSPVFIYLVWGAQELVWLVFPSTPLSSAIVVSCLMVQVFGPLWASDM